MHWNSNLAKDLNDPNAMEHDGAEKNGVASSENNISLVVRPNKM